MGCADAFCWIASIWHEMWRHDGLQRHDERLPTAGPARRVRRLPAPWWSARADRLATLLEVADTAGETVVELGGHYFTSKAPPRGRATTSRWCTRGRSLCT